MDMRRYGDMCDGSARDRRLHPLMSFVEDDNEDSMIGRDRVVDKKQKKSKTQEN